MAIRDIVREILDEESAAAKAAKKAGLVHLGFGRYGPKKGKPATHVSMGGGLEKLGTAKKKSDKKKSKKSADEPQMGPGQPSGDEPQMGLKPFKTKATKVGGGTGVDADYFGGDFTKSADYDMWSDDEPSHPDDMDDRDVFQFLNKDEPEDEKSSYFDDPADLSPSQKAHTAAADAELDRIDREKLAKGEPLDGTPLFPDDEEPEQSAYDKMGSEARELKTTMDSTEEGYQQQYIPILKNLSKKMKNGTYDKEKAVKLFMYYVANGAKRYAKDFGGGGATGPSVGGFDKKTREEAARAYVEDFEDDWDNKNWDFMESITFNGSRYRRVNESRTEKELGETKMNESVKMHTITGNKRFMTKTALVILRKYGVKNVKVHNVGGDYLEVRFPIDSNKLKKLDKELKRKNKTAYGGIVENRRNKMTEDILRKVIREEIREIVEEDDAKSAFDAPIPAGIERFMKRFIDAVRGARLNRRRTAAILGRVVAAMGVEPGDLQRYVRLVKKGL